MSDYKIIACDLDGTLLDSHGHISEENFDAIRELASSGVEFVPSTGRTVSEIPDELMKNPHIRYYIYANGAGVYDKKTGERILLCMSKDTSNKVLDIVCSYDAHIVFRYNGECFADISQQTDEIYEYYTVCPNHRSVIRAFANKVENLTDFCRTLDNVEVFTIFFKNETYKNQAKNRLAETGEVCVMDSFSYGYALEICGINSGKGNALRALANKLNLSIDQTIATGDSDNDRTMIDAAGLSLAPSNSCQSIKNSADAVICSNDEHVVKYILENYIK